MSVVIGSLKTLNAYAWPIDRWIASAAGGTSQRLYCGPAIDRSRSKNDPVLVSAAAMVAISRATWFEPPVHIAPPARGDKRGYRIDTRGENIPSIMDSVVIGSARRHWAFIAVIAFACGALGIVGIGIAHRSAVAWVVTIIGGAGGLIAAWEFHDRRPRLVIDDGGILDRALAVGTIGWDDIQDVRLARVNGRPQLCLDLPNAAKYTSRLPQPLRRIVPLNRQLGLTDLSVDLSGLATDPVVLETAIRDELKKRRQGPARP